MLEYFLTKLNKNIFTLKQFIILLNIDDNFYLNKVK